jgi:hypothetical protein
VLYEPGCAEAGARRSGPGSGVIEMTAIGERTFNARILVEHGVQAIPLSGIRP